MSNSTSKETIDAASLIRRLDRMMRRAERLQRDIHAFEPTDMEPQMKTCQELRQQCKELGVPGRWRMRHGELVVAVREAAGRRRWHYRCSSAS